MRGTRGVSGLVLAVVATAVVVGAPGAAADEPRLVGELGLGDSVFWYDELPASRPTDTPGTVACSAPGSGCLRYHLDVAASGSRLRVALSHVDQDDLVDFALYDPSGSVAARSNPFTGEGGFYATYDHEFFVERPAAGRWTVEVAPGDNHHTPVALRARLERTAPRATGREVQLPNLQLSAPRRMTLRASLTLARARAAELGEREPLSCLPEETAARGVRRCLRFSVGPMNVGKGPLELRFSPLEGTVQDGEVTQVIRRGDGSEVTRPAGRFRYHATHAHYHHVGFGEIDLLRVDDATTGLMREVSSSPKIGFCLAPVFLVDFASFGAERPTVSDCGLVHPPTGARMVLSPGWGDEYPWYLAEQYVPFDGLGDGLYVLRGTSDPTNVVAESDETDNTSYAFVRVSGERVDVLERGRGRDPWDPRAVPTPREPGDAALQGQDSGGAAGTAS